MYSLYESQATAADPGRIRQTYCNTTLHGSYIPHQQAYAHTHVANIRRNRRHRPVSGRPHLKTRYPARVRIKSEILNRNGNEIWTILTRRRSRNHHRSGRDLMGKHYCIKPTGDSYDVGRV